MVLVVLVEEEVGTRETGAEEEDDDDDDDEVLDSEEELLSSLGVVVPTEVVSGVVSVVVLATGPAAGPAAGSALGSVVGSAPVVASCVGGSATLSTAERRTLATSAATGTSEAWLLRVAPAKRRASALVLLISCSGGLEGLGFDCLSCNTGVKRLTCKKVTSNCSISDHPIFIGNPPNHVLIQQ